MEGAQTDPKETPKFISPRMFQGGVAQTPGEQRGSELSCSSHLPLLQRLTPNLHSYGEPRRRAEGLAGSALLLGCPGWIPAGCEGPFWGLWCPTYLHPGDGAGQAARADSPELPAGSNSSAFPICPINSQAGGAGSLQKGEKNSALACISVCAGCVFPQNGFLAAEKRCPPMATPIFCGANGRHIFPCGERRAGSTQGAALPSRQRDCSQSRVAGRNIFLFAFASFTCLFYNLPH